MSDYSTLLHTDWKFWASILYLSIFATVIAYIWYLESIHEIGVYKTAVFQNTLPFMVIIIGFVIYDETVSALSLLFSFVVILGVYMTNIATKK